MILLLMFIGMYVVLLEAQVNINSRYISVDESLEITIKNYYDKDIVVLNSDGVLQRSEISFVVFDINGDLVLYSSPLIYHAYELTVLIKSNEEYVMKHKVSCSTNKYLNNAFKINKIIVYHTVKFLKESNIDSTKKDYIEYIKEETIFLDNTL